MDEMDEVDLNIYSLAYPVTALGPGNRVVLWVAGCGKRCEGCISPEMRDPDAGKRIPVETLVRHLIALPTDLDGITVSGGEPFDQAEALARFLDRLRAERPGWSVIVYTGYTQAEACRRDAGAALIKCIDILIDRPYCSDIPSSRALTGSGNQEIHYLTAKGRALQGAIETFPRDAVNWGLGRAGFDMMIGVVDAEARTMLKNGLRGVGNGDTLA